MEEAAGAAERDAAECSSGAEFILRLGVTASVEGKKKKIPLCGKFCSTHVLMLLFRFLDLRAVTHRQTERKWTVTA